LLLTPPLVPSNRFTVQTFKRARACSQRSFRNEYLGLLKKFDVEFKEEYAFEWIE